MLLKGSFLLLPSVLVSTVFAATSAVTALLEQFVITVWEMAFLKPCEVGNPSHAVVPGSDHPR